MCSRTSLRSRCLVLFVLGIASTLAAAQAGQLDPSFGQGGIVTTDFGSQANTANGITLQTDGKIVVCGGILGSSGFLNAAVLRYNTDGSLDTTFGTSGIALAAGILNTPAAITLQKDGKIVVAGFFNQITVIRFNSNGSLDSTFANGGVFNSGLILEPANPRSAGVAVQPDGKILAAGGQVMLRLSANGQLDSGFGGSGKARLAGYAANALALLPSGKILVASAFGNSGFVTRYSSNGSLDTSFGINGQLATAGPPSSLLLLSSGEFLVGGTLTGSVSEGPTTAFAVSRYQGYGATDTKFATHGGVVTTIAGRPTIASSGLGVQSSGDIVTLGTASSSSSSVFALARYTPTGQLDTTFGTNGIVTTDFGTTVVSAAALAIQSDGKIVTVGNYETTLQRGYDYGFKLARYLGQ